MKPLASHEIRGTWGAVLLPLNVDESIDYGALAAQLDEMVAAGLDGIYSNGTAGEFHAQTENDFDRVSLLVAERCERAGIPFQLGVCHMSAQLSRERLRRVRELAPGAVQVIMPDWVPVTPAEAEAFLAVMAELAGPVGLVLYTPGHAKRPLDLSAVAKLRALVPGLIGVKTPDGNASWYAAMRNALPDFSVFVPGHHLATGRRLGASGSYSNVACLSPWGARHWSDQMEHDPAEALAFESRLLGFFQRHISPLAGKGYSPAAIDKALAAAGGWAPGLMPRLRWPYRSVDSQSVAAIAEASRRELPELWIGNHRL